MNKIYKLVWSKVRNAWVVTSEIAKGHGKDSSSERNGKRLKLAVMTAILGGCFMTAGISPVAALTDDQQAVYDAVMAELNAKRGVAHYFSVNSDDKNAPDGTNWKNDGATGEDAIAIGKKAVSEGSGSIAIGKGSKVFNVNTSYGMAIGDGAESSFGSIVIGKYARDYDTDPKNGVFGIFIGSEAKSFGGSAQTVLGYSGQAKGQGSTAIGSRAHALGGQSSAVGEDSQALQQGAAAFGAQSIAEFDDSTALGSYANGRGNKSVASGNKSVAAGHNSVAIGYQSFAHNGFIDEDAYKALSPDEQKKYFEASGLDGYFLKDTADGNDVNKIGHTYLNTAVGSYSRADKHATTLGGATSAKEEGTAVGTYAKASQKGAASLGYKAKGNVENGVALGAYSVADREKGKIGYVLGGDNSTLEKALETIGQKAKYDELIGKIDPLKDEYNGLLKAYLDAPAKSAEETTAKQKLDKWKADHPDFLSAVKEKQQMIGAWQSGSGAVSVGKAGATRQITNVAAGTEDTDAVNVAQLKALNTKVDQGAIHYFSVNSDDKNTPDRTNWKNDGATGEDAIAIGRKARAYGLDSSATGENAWSIGNYSQAWGYYALAGAEEGIDKAAYDALSEAEKENYTLRKLSIGGEDKSLYYRTTFKEYTNDEFKALSEQERKDLTTNKGYGYHSGKKVWTPTPRAIAIGHLSKAIGAATVAVGNLAEATGIQSTAIGTQANASGGFSFAAGDRAKAQHKGTIAIGMKANASGKWSTAVGSYAEASGEWGTALGLSAKAQSENGVALGASTLVDKKDAVSLGYKAKGKVESGVALGAYSVADREKGKIGYALGGDNSTLEKALESIGQKAKYEELTGKIDPLKDEYNGLVKAYQKAPANSAEETTAKQKLDKWIAGHPDFLPAVKEKKQMIDAWQSGNGAVSVGSAGASRQITNVAAGTEDTDAVNVAQLKALNTKVDEGAIHYYSVTSDKKAAGSNFDNDGAKAADSMVIGIGSSSEAPNSTVLGNNNTLKRHITDKNGSLSLNNIVIGQSLEVEGAYNAVFGTDYQNRDYRKTMVAGKYNTVIGVGNLAGYTAEKDPQDPTKWIYKKVEDGSDSNNVVVGMNNTATRSSIVIGAESEASSLGTSVGSNNKVIGNGDKGLALGNSLTVDGEQAVAIGSDSQAKADYAVAIGQEALAEKESSIAFGNSAKAQNNYSVAIGAFADAKSRSGVAIGSSSLADREKGIKGYLAGKDDESEIWKSTRGAVSVGNNEKKYTRQIIGVAAGSEDTDAVNVAQLKALNTKVEGNKIHYLSIGPDNEKNLAQDGNYNNDGADSHWGIAIGVNASSKGGGSIAIGKGSQAHGTEEHRAQGVSIGSASRAIGAFATAVGHDTKAFGEYSAAYGLGDAYGRGSIAIGSGAVAALKEGITKEEYDKLSDEEKAWYGKADYDDQKVFYQFRHKGKDGKVEDIKNYGMAIGSGATSFDNAGLAVGLNAKTKKDFGVALGAYAENKVEQGVALGTSSVADRAKDVKGYLPTTGKAIENFEEAMKATGKEAAFKELNGKYLAAQEKLAKAQEAYNADQSPTNMMNLDKAQKELKGLTEEYAVMTAPWTSRRGAVSVGNDKTGFTRQIIGVAAGSEDTDAVNVAQLKALNTKVDKGAIHYYSVTSDKKAAGSNFDNDGAKGTDSMVIGIGSSSEAENSTVLGNNNTLKRYNADQNGSSSRNNIVVGQNMEVEGAHNAVFGTDYQNNLENRKTMVAGKHNTVIGVGNLAGYTAEKDPQNRFKWIYSKVENGSDSGNVVVGMNNTATRGSLVIGSESEATSSGISVGNHNKVVSDEDFGVALGSDLVVDGYQALAIGSKSEAKADYTVAIGGGALAEKENSIAFGNEAKAQNNYSVAFGSFATATARSGVALGSSSLANREKGALGYLAEANTTSEAWKATRGAISIGNSDKKYTRQLTGLAAGTEDTDAVNVAQLKAVNAKVDQNKTDITEINKKITNLGESSGWTLAVARGDDSKTDSEATAEGTSTKVSGGTVTLKAGRGVKLKQDGTNVQIGLKFIDMDPAGYPFNDAKASGGGSLAVGQNSVAKAHQATAVGLDTEADEYGVALGTTSKAGKSAVAIGSRAFADGTDSIAIGEGKRKVENDPTQGYRKVDSDYAIAIGASAAIGEKSDASSAVGYYAEIAQSEWSNAFGGYSKIENSNYASTFGTSSKVKNAAYGTALGNLSRVENAAFGTALGNNAAVIDAQGGVAIGAHSVANRNALMPGYNPTGEQWSNFQDYLEKTGQKDAYNQATAKIEAAKQAWEADKSNPELRAKVGQAIAEQNKIVNVWVGTQGAVSIGNEQAGFTRQLTGLAAGTNDTDAVNVAQLKALAMTPMNFYFGGKKEGNTYTPGKTNWSMPLNEFRMDFGDGLKAEQVEKDGKKYTLVTLDKESLKGDPNFKGDTGAAGKDGADGKSAYETWKDQKDNQGNQPNKDKTEKEFLDSLKGKDGKDGTGTGGAAVEAGDNIYVDKKDPTKTVVSLKDNIDVKSVKVGDVTIKDNKITGIAPGEISKDSKDAVNGSQLFATNQQVANNMYQINNLRDESREGDALGAAMAALKPIDFDPYQRSQVMAGVGYYRGKEAVALGLAHYKNEDLMFHGGLAYAGNSELMANIGVTYRFGSKDDRDIKHDRNLRMPQYAEGPISSVYILQDEVDRLTKENKEANDRIAALEAKLEKVLEKVK